MTNEKMTKREVLNAVLEALDRAVMNDAGDVALVDFDPKIIDEVKAYALNEINLLDKKAEKAKGVQSKTQKENEGIKTIILEILAKADKPKTVSEIIKENVEFADLSNQKVSALLAQLVKAEKVVKTVDKKKSYFAVA